MNKIFYCCVHAIKSISNVPNLHNTASKRRMKQTPAQLQLLLLILLSSTSSSHAEDWYWALNKCGSSTSWGSRVCPTNSVLYCRFSSSSSFPPGCPADAATSCSKASYPLSCIDESCLCKKDFYAYGAEFACSSSAQYVGNGGYYPKVPEIFECKACPYGHFCTGGVETKLVVTTMGLPPEEVVVGHALPQMCPFAGMVAKKGLPLFANPCVDPETGRKVQNCDYESELRILCTTLPESCPCECPPKSGSELLQDASAYGGMSCGCKPGYFWNNSNLEDMAKAWRNLTTTMGFNRKMVNMWDSIPMPIHDCVPCGHNAFCPGMFPCSSSSA